MTLYSMSAFTRCDGKGVRSDDDPNTAVVQQLVAKVSNLEAKVTSLESELTIEKQRTQKLEDESNRQVAFTAWASHGPSISASDGSTVPFGGLILNEGSAFSTSTGVFTAPYSGTYMFFVHADISGDYRGFSVRKNGAVVVLCHNDSGDHRLACGCTVSLHVGDHVAVAHIGNSGVVDAGRETAFSGFRIH